MSIAAGDAGCTTGLSGSIWTTWAADPAAMLALGSTSGVNAAKAMIYRWAVAIAAAHNADGGAGGSFVDGEVPSGVINGANVTFTLANAPITGSLHLYLNGVRLRPGTDYSITTATITMAMVPQTGDWLYADYRR